MRAILKNEAYTGKRVWAKQQKVEQLIDPNDVAAGNQVRMRWRKEELWIRPQSRTHAPLVPDDLFEVVRVRLAAGTPGKATPRPSSRTYLLRGLLYCAHCGRRMEGAWRKSRSDGSAGRTLYRCAVRGTRALPANMEGHPKTLHVREDAILEPLDGWIASLVAPHALASAEHDPDSTSTRAAALRARLAEVDRKIASLVEAVENGLAIPEISDQVARRSKERTGLAAELSQLQQSRRLSVREVEKALDELGGIAKILPSADPALRSKLYGSLGVRLEYDHVLKRVRATADNACVAQRVRRGT